MLQACPDEPCPPREVPRFFAARLRTARSETPGWRILCLSPASFAGRLDLISDENGNSAVRLEAGLDFGTTFTRSYTTGLLSTVPQKTRHSSRTTALSSLQINLDTSGVNGDRPQYRPR